MSVLQEIAQNLKNQNDLNQKIITRLEKQQPGPDAEEEREDAQREKMSALKKMGGFVKGIADQLFLNKAKDVANGFLDLLKQNTMLAIGMVGIESLLNNWDRFEEFFKGVGEFLEGPVAKAIDFFKKFTPNFVSAMKSIYGVAGIAGVAAALIAFTRPASTLIALVKATTLAVRGISVLFRGGKFLAGLLGRRGLGRLGLLAAIPLLAGGAAAASSEAVEEMPDMTESARAMALEGDYEGAAQLMSTFNEDNGGTMLPPGGLIKSPVQADYWENWASENQDYQPTASPTGPVEEPTPLLDSKGETPVAEQAPTPMNLTGRLDSKGTTPSPSVSTPSPAMSSRLDSKGITPTSQNLSINPNVDSSITSTNGETTLLQEISYNTEVTQEKQTKKAEMMVKAIAEKWSSAVETGLIENSFGTSYDDPGLSIMTA